MYCVGVNVFVMRDGKLLLGQRKHCSGEGSWGLPGGHLEHGESMESAGLRELMEETGLQADSLTFVNIVNDRSRGQHYIQTGFLANNISGEVGVMEPDRCECWEWFDVDLLPKNLFHGHEAQIEIFRQDKIFRDN
ncbi:NUDIX domain-containing protein [Candidatus Uhrbacteria bacterium]|nr:NUDIX domain-containing protein [Candidatus Uhrbacteria bacterium]MBT7717536.1 NUDIX domain-containing protein [Candidatus Uhrbacteria bacterium]